MKEIVLHTGYFSCERGVVFNDDEEIPARVDTSFNEFKYKKHQSG